MLPSELLHATYSDFDPELYRGLETACVASDRIFFTHNNNDLTWDLYCIDLTVDDLVMEYCGLLGYVDEEPEGTIALSACNMGFISDVFSTKMLEKGR